MLVLPWFEPSDYVTSSYVWGGSQGLQLLKLNKQLLEVKGALRAASSNIPAVIRDAIELVRDLNTADEEETRIIYGLISSASSRMIRKTKLLDVSR